MILGTGDSKVCGVQRPSACFTGSERNTEMVLSVLAIICRCWAERGSARSRNSHTVPLHLTVHACNRMNNTCRPEMCAKMWTSSSSSSSSRRRRSNRSCCSHFWQACDVSNDFGNGQQESFRAAATCFTGPVNILNLSDLCPSHQVAAIAIAACNHVEQAHVYSLMCTIRNVYN